TRTATSRTTAISRRRSGSRSSTDNLIHPLEGANNMRYTKLLTFMTLLLATTACDDDGVTVQGDPPPKASVRFVNAVPDTGTVDLRFWDQVENLPSLLGVAFRSYSGMYQGVEP